MIARPLRAGGGLLLLLAATPCCAASTIVPRAEGQQALEARARVGEEVGVAVSAPVAVLYHWTFAGADAAVFEVLAPRPAGAAEVIPGGAATTVYPFRALKTGCTAALFSFVSDLNPSEVGDRFTARLCAAP